MSCATARLQACCSTRLRSHSSGGCSGACTDGNAMYRKSGFTGSCPFSTCWRDAGCFPRCDLALVDVRFDLLHVCVRPDACVVPSAHNRGTPTLPPTMCAAATAHLEGVRVEDKLGVVLPVLAVRRPACKRQHIKINGGEHGSWLAQARARWLPFVGCACGGGLGRPRVPPPRARGRGVAVGSCPGRARAAGFGLGPRVAPSLHACKDKTRHGARHV